MLDPGEPPAEPLPSIPEWLGAYAIDATTVEMPLADSLRNPWGILHGGAVASLIDLAAEHVTGGITTDVVLHFLAPNRVGPGAPSPARDRIAPTAPCCASRCATKAPTA